jgi:hemolysin activation/secretion protein
VRGSDLHLEVDTSGEAVTGTLQARTFLLPRPGHNLCALFSLQATSGQTDPYLFKAGGLREIRGFPDAFFQGQELWRWNVEYRWDFLQLHVLIPAVGQLAAFTDGGYVAKRAQSIAGLDCVGAGARYIPIPFARAVARLDFAFGLEPRRTVDISFGGQQFF